MPQINRTRDKVGIDYTSHEGLKLHYDTGTIQLSSHICENLF